jgi:hypothetical protein
MNLSLRHGKSPMAFFVEYLDTSVKTMDDVEK